MTIDIAPSALLGADLPLGTPSSSCAACGLPGDLRKTPAGTFVLLEHNDVVAPLTAADIPALSCWAPVGHLNAIRLPDDAGLETVCQVEHQLVCPADHRDLSPRSPRLQERRRLNMDRRQCARDRYQEDDPGL
ncbi:DUF6083 domain-containing protein [Streptomyces omiyaensis]|uniref:DUF6083 domain-containing protein n=1 Tax=Streptomyces omiyaensis TaxID=68247 RepID=UPI003702A8C1